MGMPAAKPVGPTAAMGGGASSSSPGCGACWGPVANMVCGRDVRFSLDRFCGKGRGKRGGEAWVQRQQHGIRRAAAPWASCRLDGRQSSGSARSQRAASLQSDESCAGPSGRPSHLRRKQALSGRAVPLPFRVFFECVGDGERAVHKVLPVHRLQSGVCTMWTRRGGSHSHDVRQAWTWAPTGPAKRH